MKNRATAVAIIAAAFAFVTLLLAVSAPAQAQTPTPSSALLVLNKAENSLAILDPATQKVVARIPTGEGPHEIAASSDGKLAVVTNYGAKDPATRFR